MRASVIVAAHNEDDALVKTVAACVEAGGGMDYEIVLIDDASHDGSVERARREFPRLRVFRHDRRLGAAATKTLGAEQARGEVLVFLDGHTKPEDGAILRLVEDVERHRGECVVTPRIPALNVERWTNCSHQVGHGYRLDLEQFDCGWLGLSRMREIQSRGRRFYESPALIGCALAVSRELYAKLWGFDAGMRSWGVEDLDFGLKCWLLGHRVLHDPEATIGHRFRKQFDNYSVPVEHLAANQLRMARKNFTPGVWSAWLDRARKRHAGRLQDHPEGLWARVWQLFEENRGSVERERSYLMAHRRRDEFWYAERFGLPWPRLESAPSAAPFAPPLQAFAEPSPSPCPGVTIIFNPSPIITGFALPPEQVVVKASVTVTVSPPEEAANVEIVSGGKVPARVAIENIKLDAANGTITFDVLGVSATPDDIPKGDTKIEARMDGKICKDVPVVVVVPTAVHHPDSLPDSIVDAENLVGNSKTSPVWYHPSYPLGTGEVGLATAWIQWMDIRVDDQFGHALNTIYAGVSVFEQLGGNWVDINQDMTGGGTYADPVSYFRVRKNPVVPEDSFDARNWPLPSPPPALDMQPFNGQGGPDIPIRVGGHALAGIIGRYVIATPEAGTHPKRGRVRVVWPEPD